MVSILDTHFCYKHFFYETREQFQERWVGLLKVVARPGIAYLPRCRPNEV
jgi:hypothetical protein